MADSSENTYLFGEFQFDAAESILRRGDLEIPLPPKVLEVLSVLVEKQGKIVGKDELMNIVWAGSFVEEGSLSQCIYALRRALGKDENGSQIVETIPRRGFRIALPVAVKVRQNDEPVGTERPAEQRPLPERAAFSRLGLFSIAVILFVAVTASAVSVYFVFIKNTNAAPVENVTFQKLTFSGDIKFPVISPDGNSFAFVRENNVFVQEIGSGKSSRLDIPNHRVFANLQFTPDGTQIAFRNEERSDAGGDTFVVSRFGGEAKRIGENIWSGVGFSADGRRIAFIRFLQEKAEWALLEKDLPSGSERQLLSRKLPNTIFRSGFPAWSPDGKKLAIVEQIRNRNDRSALLIVTADSGEAQMIETPQLTQIEQAAWHRNGRDIVLVGRERSRFFQLWKLDYKEKTIQRITNDLSIYRFVTLSADGNSLLARQQTMNSHVWIANENSLADMKQPSFGNLNRDGNIGLNWTPDGRILYSSRIAGNIDLWSVNPSDGTRRQLTENAGSNNVRPIPSHDGKYIYFESNRTGTRHIWRIDADGSNPKQVTFSDSESEYSPEISADGEWLYFVQTNAKSLLIARKSLIGDQTETLSHIKNIAPDAILSLSPDGKRIAYHVVEERNDDPENEQLMTFAIAPVTDSGVAVELYRLKSSNSKVWWTKDGNGLEFFQNTPGRVAKIWRLSFDRTMPASVVLELPNTNLFYLARSKDYDNLALAKGVLETDTILLKNF